MKYYGEIRHIETQIAIATSNLYNDASEARRAIDGEAFIRGYIEPKEDAPDELYYISKDGRFGLYYCCK